MSKEDKAKLAEGAAAIRKAQGAKGTAKATDARGKAGGQMQFHPAAKLFPSLPAKELRELKADIATNGIRVPLLVNKAKDTIIDGRNRWMIALDLGLPSDEIPMDVWKGTEEEIPGEVLSRNVFRRHLNNDQRVSLITKVRAPQLEAEAKERMAKKGTFGAPVATDGKGTVAQHIAKEADVAVNKAEQALKARKAGQLDAVIEKKKTLRAAASEDKTKKPRKTAAEKLAAQPFEEQVWARWDKWVKGWPPPQWRAVKQAVYGFLLEDKGITKPAKS
jgi:hypothetical protein